MRKIAIGAVLIGSVTAAHAATILKQEPAMGALREGQTVYVDNGSCPKGQILRVVGGNHVRVGGYKEIVRSRSCVPRP
jgi:hypothetical protein